MGDLQNKERSVKDDTARLQSEIRTILGTLIGNKDLVQVVATKNITQESHDPSSRLVAKSSDLSPELVRKSNASANSSVHYAKDVEVDKDDMVMDTSTTSVQFKLRFATPTYTYLESKTFLAPVLNRWVWGTTIVNTSKTVAPFPHLTLSLIQPTSQPFCYNVVISPDDSSLFTSEFPVDLPFQHHSSRCGPPLNRIQPGCTAKITAIFDTPPGYWTLSEDRRGITACLTVSGKFQWCHKISLSLADVSVCKGHGDETRKFEHQILSGMTSCQEKFSVDYLLTQPQINQSLSKAFTRFLVSLGFKQSDSRDSISDVRTFACGLPSQLFGALATIYDEDRNKQTFQFTFSASSHRQMEALVASLVSWRNQLNNNFQTSASAQPQNSIRISSLSEQTCSDAEKRSTLLAEIEILRHLIFLAEKNDLSSPHVVSNWIEAFAEASARTDLTMNWRQK